ncbi:signal transduction histidine kinase [Mumia flava]|uniref:histidine kinase n=1 Tax=Mumia flava TaxID=1348852 RepID=A0A2M9BIX8_9ACTN|nr:signal transduction histidine kinase [Mumia flava]
MLLAAGCAVWAAVLLRDAPTGVLVLVPTLFATGLLAAQRRPLVGALVVGAGQAVGLVLGAPEDNASGLAAGLAALFLLGRRARPVAGLPALVLFCAIIVATDLPTGRHLLGIGLFAATWALGTATRRAFRASEDARQRALRAEERDVAATARHLVEEQTQRHAVAAVLGSETALLRMRAELGEQAGPLSADRLAGIESIAREAVEELRSVLRTLRRPSAANRDGAAAPAPGGARPSLRGRDVARAVAVVGLVLLEHAVVGERVAPALAVAIALALGAAALLVRTAPVQACAAAAAVPVVGLATGATLPTSAVEIAVLIVVAWSAAPHWRRGWPVLVVLLVSSGLAERSAASHVAVVAASALLGCVAGLAWSVAARERTSWQVREDAHREAVKVSADRGTAAERLRLARDLHDVVSHSLAVATLQAAAAARQLAAGVDRTATTRTELCAVVDQALVDLASLAAVVAPDPLVRVAPDHVVADLRRRAEALGIDVDWRVDLVPGPAATPAGAASPPSAAPPSAGWPQPAASTVSLIVREALTNAARHAPGTRVRVVLAARDDQVAVDVDNPSGDATAAYPGTGHGLDGLAERVSALGGRMRAVVDDGSFRLVAEVPLAPPGGASTPGTPRDAASAPGSAVGPR